MTIKEMMANKVFSARFLMSTMTTVAACLLVGLVFYVCARKGNIEAGIAVFMAFMGTWKEIVMSYFERADRDSKPTGDKPT